MKLEELSIGNYVHYKERLCKVTDLLLNFGNRVAIRRADGKDWPEDFKEEFAYLKPEPKDWPTLPLVLNPNYHHLQPSTITEELLESLGIRLYLSERRMIVKEDFLLEIWKEKGYWTCIIDKKESPDGFYHPFGRVKVQYLHQLQNFISLCRLDFNLW